VAKDFRKPVTYTVTAENGTTQNYTVTVTPTKEGYTFGGWYIDEACTIACNFEVDKITADITLYAKWIYAASATTNGWSYFQGEWYFFDNGIMVTNNWRQDSSKLWYYLGTNGVMATGWVEDGANWYFLKTSGAMAANAWVENYYLGASGAMAVNTVTPDGWTVGANGAWNGK